MCATTGRCRRTCASATECATTGRCCRTRNTATASSPRRTSPCTTTGRCRCTRTRRRHRPLVALVRARRRDDAVAHVPVRRHHFLVAIASVRRRDDAVVHALGDGIVPSSHSSACTTTGRCRRTRTSATASCRKVCGGIVPRMGDGVIGWDLGLSWS